MTDETKSKQLSIKDILIKGSFIAIITTVPSLVALVVSWKMLDDFLMAAFIGGVVHFSALILSFKISKKLLIKR